MWKIFLYAILIYFLYNLIFRFIIPIYRASKQMKQKFREMHEKMQQQGGQYQTNGTQAEPSVKPGTNKQNQKGDYIEFEEVK